MSARIALASLAMVLWSCAAGDSRDEDSSTVVVAHSLAWAGACAHDPCVTGNKLSASCDACAAAVCAADGYCCGSRWDQQCVDEVGTDCAAGYCSRAGSPDMSSGGGTGPKMKFAVFGDCRPASLDQTNGYPSDILGGVFSLAQSSGAQFAVGTGDYMFADSASAVSAQVQLFLQARANFKGPVYLDMGNHECNGYTSSNCPHGDETPNVQAFMSQLAPSGVSAPYFRVDVQAAHGSAKLLFVAANAWSATQQSWLQEQLAQPTMYTFVIRHEPKSAGTAPGVNPSESLIGASSYTLELNGHTHEYKHVDTRHVISGNAGAPLQSGASYGLLLVEEQDDGNVTVTELDESTGEAVDSWTVTPTGQGA